MRFKKILIILVLIIFVMAAFTVNSFAVGVKATAFIKAINDEIKDIYGFENYYKVTNIDGESLREDLLLSDHRLIYGKDHDYVEKVKKYRNSGYTYGGDNYPNKDYPPDAWGMKIPIEEWSWVENSWEKIDKTEVGYNANLAGQATIKNLLLDDTFDSTSYDKNNKLIGNRYIESIVLGIGEKLKHDTVDNGKKPALNGTYDDRDKNGNYIIPWHKYVHILQPPTEQAWGIGVMVHYSSKQYWYLVIPLAPTEMVNRDLGTRIIDTGVPNGQKAKPGEKYTAKVEYYLNGWNYMADCYFKQNGNALLDGNVTLNQSNAIRDKDKILRRTFTKQWTCPYQKEAVLESYIAPADYEVNTGNNKAVEKVEVDYNVIKADSADGCFLDDPKKIGNRMETYIIRGLHYPITDPVSVRLKVWLVEDLDESKQLSHTALTKNSWGKLIVDKDMVFTAEKPYWIEKITYDVPAKGKQSGIIVQTGDKNAVESVTWYASSGSIVYGTHTTSREKIMDWLPWGKIEADTKYKIKRAK